MAEPDQDDFGRAENIAPNETEAVLPITWRERWGHALAVFSSYLASAILLRVTTIFEDLYDEMGMGGVLPEPTCFVLQARSVAVYVFAPLMFCGRLGLLYVGRANSPPDAVVLRLHDNPDAHFFTIGRDGAHSAHT